METANDLPEGFKPVEHDAELIDAIPRDRFAKGVTCTYMKRRDLKPTGADKSGATVQYFKAENGTVFCTWGTADLDGKLSQVKPGAVIFIRYDGLGDHPTNATRTMHRWTVAEKAAPARPAAVAAPKPADDDDLPF